MLVFPSQSGVRRALLAAGAAFLLVAAFPSSAGWRVFFLLVALSVLLWEAWRRRESLGWRNIPRALVIAAAAWIAIDIASLAWSVDPGYTLQEIRRELAYGALAFVVFFSATREPWQMHVWIVTLLAGALLLGLGEWLHVFFPDAWLIRKSSMGPGPFSTHVLMLAPLLVILVWQAPVGMGRSIAFTALAGVALVIAGLAGESRILWVALLVATAVAFATFWTQAPPDHPGRRAARRAFVVALAVLPLMMALSAEYKLRYYPRAGSTFEAFAYDERPFIWHAAWRKLGEHPWIGHGYGREIVAADIRVAVEAAGSGNRLNHGHNVFLDAALQTGALGLAAFTALMAALAWAFATTARRAGGLPLAIAGLALLAGYLTKNLTDDFFFRPSSLIFWAMAGMLLGLAARLPAKS